MRPQFRDEVTSLLASIAEALLSVKRLPVPNDDAALSRQALEIPPAVCDAKAALFLFVHDLNAVKSRGFASPSSPSATEKTMQSAPAGGFESTGCRGF